MPKIFRKFANRVLVVSFDELLLYPDRVMDSVCGFLGLIFQKRMLDGYKYNPYYPATELKTKKAHGENRRYIDPRLDGFVPPAHAKYEALLTLAQQQSFNNALQG